MLKVNLKGRVAVITGAGRGIGEEIAIELASSGADIVLLSDIKEELDVVAKKIKRIGRKVLAMQTDVQVSKQVETSINSTINKFGKIDILVNNAGVVIREPFVNLSESSWDKVININLKGAFICSQTVSKFMKLAKKGTIVNMGSITGIMALRNLASYGASKAGLMSLTRTMALELAQYNITVNSIAPGFIMTDLTKELFEKQGDLKKLLEPIPLKRPGKVEDVANAVLFLVSEESNYITGTTLVVDGGWMVGYMRDW